MHRDDAFPPPAALLIGSVKARHARLGRVERANDDHEPWHEPDERSGPPFPFFVGIGWALVLSLPIWYGAIRFWTLFR